MLGKKEDYFKEVNSFHTANEIVQQPKTWQKTLELIKQQKGKLKEFLKFLDKDTDVILVGAGTSEFVGNTIINYINDLLEQCVRSVATTDIVSHPEHYFKKDKKLLLVSYGRSGSSPESVATVDLANQIVDEVRHLVITCNEEGSLSKMSAGSEKYHTIQLPEETHDVSFAMTSSYTNMMLATILAFDCDNLELHARELAKACEMASQLLDEDYKVLNEIVTGFNFDRIVYLGASYLKGTAQESALKMLELSGGKVATLFDTPLGFRHGPKSIIQENVLTVLYHSDREYAYQYEKDLAKEMLAERDGNKILIVRNNHTEEMDADYKIEFNTPSFESDVYLNFVYIIVGQIIALKKSISLGISADNPCPSGEVNRVVQGVQIYNY